MTRNLKRSLFIGIGLAVGVYLLMGLYADYSELLASLEGFQWYLLLPALVLVCVSYSFRFLRWEYLLRVINVRLALMPSFAIFLAGLTMAISPAKLGEVMKSFLIKDHSGIKVSRSSPVIVAERLADVIAVVILGAVGSLAYGAGREILVVTVVLVAVFVAVVQTRSLCMRLLKMAERVPLVRKFAGHLEEFYESSYSLLRLKHLGATVAISMVGWLLECVASLLILRGLGVDAGFLMVTFVFSIGTLAGAVAMIPGGLGVAEGSMTGLFVANGIARSDAVAATLLVRIVTFWFPIVLGLIGIGIYGAIARKRGQVPVPEP